MNALMMQKLDVERLKQAYEGVVSVQWTDPRASTFPWSRGD